jgi:hypothetical protein
VTIPGTHSPEDDRDFSVVALENPEDLTAWNPSLFILAIPFPPSPAEGELSAPGLPWGIQAGLRFISEAQNRQSGRDMMVAFLSPGTPPEDAGDTPGLYPLLEDLYFLLEDPEYSLLLYLDLPREPSGGFFLYQGARGSLTPLALVQSLYSTIIQAGLPCSFEIRFNEFYKLGLLKGPPVLEFARDKELTALALGPGIGPDFGAGSGGFISPETLGTLGSLLAEYGETATVPPGLWDINYSIINVGRAPANNLFVSERASITLLLGAAGLSLVLLLFISLINRYVTSPVRVGFFGRTSVVLVFMDLLGGALLSLPNVPTLILVLVFTCLGAASPVWPAVFIFALASPVLIAGRILLVLRDGSLAELALISYPLMAVFLFGVAVPFLLLVTRGIILFRRKKHGGLGLQPPAQLQP